MKPKRRATKVSQFHRIGCPILIGMRVPVPPTKSVPVHRNDCPSSTVLSVPFDWNTQEDQVFCFSFCLLTWLYLQGLGLSCSILASLIRFRVSARRYEKGNRVRFAIPALPSDDLLYAYRLAIHAHAREIHPARLSASIPPDAVGPCGVGLIH